MSGGGERELGGQPEADALLASPRWFLRDLDLRTDSALLTPMSEQSYRESVFLDSRIVRDGERDRAVPLSALLKFFGRLDPPLPVLRYVFHLGHCGSTLVSKLLGDLPGTLALREPPMLMGLSRSRRGLGEPGFPLDRENWEALARLSLVMLGRRWRPDQAVIVKPTSHANDLAPWLMTRTAQERAIVLYVDLETWLTTMLRPEVRRENRLYARDFRLSDLRRLDPEARERHEAYGDAELAALTWLLLARELATVLDRQALGGRVLAVHFDAFLARPVTGLVEMATFLGLDCDAAAADRALASHAGVHAKTGEGGFGAPGRSEMLSRTRAQNAAQIREGLERAREAEDRVGAFAGLIDRFRPAKA